MKPFRFTLQAARTLRRRQEHGALKEYGGALLTHHQALGRLHLAQRKLEAVQEQVRKQRAIVVTAMELDQVHRYGTALEKDLKACEEAVAISLRVVNSAFQKFSAARRQREVVDKYFENQKRTYDRKFQVEEQKKLDELANGRDSAPNLFDLNPDTAWN